MREGLETAAMKEKKLIALGFEGSANKIGLGVDGTILSNPRHTYIRTRVFSHVKPPSTTTNTSYP